MRRKNRLLLISIMWLSFCGVAYAGGSAFQIGLGYQHMDYKEDIPAPHKSTENGWLPSIYASYEYKKPANLYAKAFMDYAAGNVTYDGTTQGGTAIKFDDSKQSLFRFEANIGYALKIKNDFLIIPYTGYGYRYWTRGEGKNTATYISYKEEYSWSYVPVGIKADYQINNKWSLGATLAAHIMFSGKMKAYPGDVIAGFRNLDFDLGNQVGYYVDIPVTYRLTANWSAVLTPWYEYSAIGQSNTVNVTYNNNVIGRAYEPASTTHQFGVRLGIARLF